MDRAAELIASLISPHSSEKKKKTALPDTHINQSISKKKLVNKIHPMVIIIRPFAFV